MDADLLPFDQVWPGIRGRVPLLGGERVALFEANGRVTREDIVALCPLPRFDNSAMDGFAVRASDTTQAPHCELVLDASTSYAGERRLVRLEPGHAVPIGTGGPIPRGADAVVPREKARVEGGRVVILEVARSQAHVRHEGEEIRAGDVVIAERTRLDPIKIAAAAAADIHDVLVSRRPRVRVVSTGDEIVAQGERVAAHQIVDTNRPMLAELAAGLLAPECVASSHVGDDPAATRETLRAALDEASVLVITGGVSVGDRDFVKDVLENQLGVSRVIWGVAQRPGKPFYFGVRGDTLVFGLPGNPGAVVSAWYAFVKPAILAMMGDRGSNRRFSVRCATPLARHPSRTTLCWCASEIDDGVVHAVPVGRSGSNMLSGLAVADLLAIVPPGESHVSVDQMLEAIPLR